MFSITISFLVLLPTIISLRTPPNPTQLKPSIKSGSLVQIDQNLYFSNCDLHADKDVLYVCSRHVYLLSEDSKGSFSRLKLDRPLAVTAAMDNNSLVVMEPNNFEVYFNYALIDHIFFHRETPLITKVKSKSEYMLIATVTKIKIAVVEEVNANDGNYGLTKGNYQEILKENYFVSAFLRGSAPSNYRTKFPVDTPITLNDNSFKDAAIYSDSLYGHDYFIVGLEKGWFMIFKSVFQDAQMNFLSTKKIGENLEILEMASVDSYLFVLLKNTDRRAHKVIIYKINTYDTFTLSEECRLDLSSFFHPGYSPQLRVKLIDDVFVLMVNFPSEEIVVYHFQKPSSGVLPLTCKKESGTIVYKDVLADTKIGYSFDYIAKADPKKGFPEHRIMLSSITMEGKSIFYIPYCMPNTYRDPVKGCVPCKTGFSLGGFSATCLPCSTALDKKSEYFERSSVIERNCPVTCDKPDKFGKNCLTCQKYMEASNAVLPVSGYWGLNSEGECGLQCRQGEVNKTVGACVTKDKKEIMTDPCIQINDCANCSMSQTCSWIQGTCKQRSKGSKKVSKAMMLEDVLQPTLKCGIPKSCGKLEYTNSSGVLQFTGNSLYKNQLCKWNINPYDGQNNRIELKVIVDGLLNSEVENLPTVYVQTYNYNVSEGGSEYSLSKLNLKKGVTFINLIATKMTLFPHIEENIIGQAKGIRIEYKVRPINNILEGVLILFKWIYYMIFLSIAFTFTFTSAQKISSYYRRRRLLLQLQGIDGIDDLDFTEEGHHALDVEKVLNNQKVVSKIVHDEMKSNKYQQTECSICLEEFKNGENLAEFNCNHVFHVKCFETWVKSANMQGRVKCPVCNRILV